MLNVSCTWAVYLPLAIVQETQGDTVAKETSGSKLHHTSVPTQAFLINPRLVVKSSCTSSYISAKCSIFLPNIVRIFQHFHSVLLYWGQAHMIHSTLQKHLIIIVAIIMCFSKFAFVWRLEHDVTSIHK